MNEQGLIDFAGAIIEQEFDDHGKNILLWKHGVVELAKAYLKLLDKYDDAVNEIKEYE